MTPRIARASRIALDLVPQRGRCVVHGCCVEIIEVHGCQFCGVMAIDTGNMFPIDMLVVLSRIEAVVLRVWGRGAVSVARGTGS